MIRFTVFDRWGRQTGTLTDVIEAVHKDEVNGEDSLTLVLASCDLTKGDRIVWRDGFGTWHEHTVNDTEDVHGDGKMYTTAYCENSIAELYTDYIDDLRPYDTTATDALQKALSNSRWEMGTVSVAGKASTNFYHESAREALADIIEAWGGELSTTIRVEGTQVSHRLVNITARRGADNGKRFEWTKDMESITREVSTDDVVTALYGYGKGLEAYDDEGNLTGGYERKLKFGEINGGLDYVADEDAKARWGLPDGKGGIKHTFGKVEFSDCEDMRELLALTKAELKKRCEPRVTYSADVVDLADAGFSSEDVRAGDVVQIVDRELGERLSGRVLCVERYLFNEQATRITLGNVARSITDVMASVRGSVSRMESHAALWDGAASISTSYIDGILASLNNTMNQTGGYTYIEPGDGIITYDKPRDQNPTMAVQIKGAGIRIANSKTSDGDWNWRTFGTGDGFSADEINAGTLNAGLIKAGILQDKAGKNYINMVTGDSRLSSSTTVVGTSSDGTAYQTTLGDVSQNLAGAMKDIDTITGTDLPLSEVRAVALRAAMQVDTEMVSRMDEYNRIKASDSYKALGQSDRTAFEGAYSAMADAAQEVLDLNTSISKATSAEQVDKMRSDLANAQETYRDAISDYEKALAPMRLRDYSTTTQMNSAIEKSATELKSTFDKTIESYSTTEQMKSAISQSADGIKSDVSKTYETKASAHARYATCYTASATQAKVATCSGFELYAGAVVSVYFAYANTALSPTLNVNGTGARGITVNGSSTSAAIKWKAYSTITFVYDGGGWRMADAGARSEIRQLADSISLSVTGSLGGTASIKLSADGDTDSETIDLSKVRAAFRDDHSAVTISAGIITFNSNTFVVNSTYFKVSSSGVITATSGTIGGFTITSYSIYNDLMSLSSSGLSLDYTVSGSKKDCGNIGTNGWHGDSSKFGLNFDLEYDAWYMTWAYRESPSASTYTVKWTYASGGFDNFTKNTLNAGCDIDMHNWKIKNLGGGITQTFNYTLANYRSDGTASSFGNGTMTFTNGLLTGLNYIR